MMAAIDALKVSGDVSNGLTLAAIGFVLLAAFTFAEMGAQLTLPRVTGYILAGIVLGPQVSNILSPAVVSEMRMFNTLALGLIALTAGLELRISSLKKVLGSLVATISIKIVLLLGLVGSAFMAAESTWGWLGLTTMQSQLAMAILISVLAIGTSPAIAVAIISESKAKGRTSDLVMGAAVLKDVVVVVLLAVAIALSKALMGSGGGGSATETMSAVGLELLSSIAAGVVLGGLLILYLRYVRAEMLLFVAAIILAVAEVSHALHLELLLVFILAGFVVGNFSKYGKVFHVPLEKVALPVFVVFFTNAGAGLDLVKTWAVLPLALLLCSVRAIAYYFSGRWGAQIGGEEVNVRNRVWLGYLPQAGVTVGLVGLAATQLPQLGTQIQTIGLAMVAINLLIGPITFRWALKLNGELPETVKQDKTNDAPEEVEEVEAQWWKANHSPSQKEELLTAVSSPKLRDLLVGMLEDVEQSVHLRFEGSVKPSLERLQKELQSMATSWTQKRGEFHAIVQSVSKAFGDVQSVSDQLAELNSEIRQILIALPTHLEVPMEARHLQPEKGDSLRMRLRKWTSRTIGFLGENKERMRTVPAQAAIRICFEEVLVTYVRFLHDHWYRVHCLIFEQLTELLNSNQTAEEVMTQLETASSQWCDHRIGELHAGFYAQLPKAAQLLENAGTWRLPNWKIRLSQSEPKVRRAEKELRIDVEEWPTKFTAVISTFRVALLADYIENEAIRIVGDKYFKPVQTTKNSIHEELSTVRTKLVQFKEAAQQSDSREVLSELLAEIRAWSEEYFAGGQRFRKTHINHYLLNREIALMFNLVLPKDVEQFDIVSPDTPAHGVLRPKKIAVSRVYLRGVFEQHLVSEVLPLVEDELESLSSSLNTSESVLRDSVEVVSYSVESELGGDKAGVEVAQSNIIQGFDRAIQKLDAFEQELDSNVQRSKEQLGTIFHQALERFRASLGKVSTVDSARSYLRGVVFGVFDWVRHGLEKAEDESIKRILSAYKGMKGVWNRSVTPESVVWDKSIKVDAGKIKEFLSQHVLERQTEDLPAVYERLFSQEPIRDRRFFAANRAQLDVIRNTEREWARGGLISGILIDGQPGTGRTSLLNVCQLDLTTERVVRVDDSYVSRQRSLLAVLANELGVASKVTSVLAKLRSQKTVILIDNFDYWLRGNPNGLTQLKEMLDVMVGSYGHAFWVVTTKTTNLRLLDSLFDLKPVLSHRCTLEPLVVQEIQEVIETRHRVSGFTLSFERQWGPNWLARVRLFDPKAVFFRVLADGSGGNLRQALALWIKYVQRSPLDPNTLRPILPQFVLRRLPFIEQLPKTSVAILGELIRYGEVDQAQLWDRFQMSKADFSRQLQFLEMSGLVERINRSSFKVPAGEFYLVHSGLKRLGIV